MVHSPPPSHPFFLPLGTVIIALLSVIAFCELYGINARPVIWLVEDPILFSIVVVGWGIMMMVLGLAEYGERHRHSLTRC